MRTLYAVFLALLLTLTGCASWIDNFRRDPVATLSTTVNYINTALGIARVAVNEYTAIAGNSSAATTFTELANNVEHGLVVAQDGLRLAADTGSSPNVPALLSDAQQAMAHVHEFLAGRPLRDASGHRRRVDRISHRS
jgi:hypothetical protein